MIKQSTLRLVFFPCFILLIFCIWNFTFLLLDRGLFQIAWSKYMQFLTEDIKFNISCQKCLHTRVFLLPVKHRLGWASSVHFFLSFVPQAMVCQSNLACLFSFLGWIVQRLVNVKPELGKILAATSSVRRKSLHFLQNFIQVFLRKKTC